MFYDIFVELCREKGVSPSAVSEFIGVTRKSATGWKSGALPRNSTLQKLAEYFNVSVDYLVGNETRTPSISHVPSESEMKIALFGGDVDVTDAMWEEARAYAQVIAARC